MIGVGRFDVDELSAIGRRALLERAFTPRSRGEALRLHLLLVQERWLGRSAVSFLAPPTRERSTAPPHEESLTAAVEVLANEAWESPLSAARPTDAPPSRRLHLHRTGATRCELLARVARADDAAAVDAWRREEAALTEAARIRPIADLVPPVVASGADASRGLRVIVQGDVDAPSLARHARLRPAGAWSIATHAEIGRRLGLLHAATRDGDRSLVHGDARSANVLVRSDGTVVGLVDWEASHVGEPLDDALGFLLRSADADLAGRGSREESLRRDGSSLARWLLVGERGAAPAARALIAAWAETLGAGRTVLEEVVRALESGRLLEPSRAADAAAAGDAARALAPLLRSSR